MRGGADRISGLLRPAFNQTDDLWTWKELHRWIELINSKDLAQGAKARIKAELAMLNDEQQHKGPSIEELKDILGERFAGLALDAAENGVAASLALIEPRLLPTKRKLVDYALSVIKHGAHRLTDLPLLTVGTIHSVKGGEADVVYLLPDLSPSGMREWLTPGPTRDAVLRLMYVGMTRAKEKLVLCSQAKNCSIIWPSNL